LQHPVGMIAMRNILDAIGLDSLANEVGVSIENSKAAGGSCDGWIRRSARLFRSDDSAS